MSLQSLVATRRWEVDPAWKLNHGGDIGCLPPGSTGRCQRDIEAWHADRPRRDGQPTEGVLAGPEAEVQQTTAKAGKNDVEKSPVNTALPIVYLARHGETAWTLSGQHTGLTDLPLTLNGERNAHRLGVRLKGRQFAKVLTSPLRRAARTCELAGFGDAAEKYAALMEWNYGEYEGLRTAEILARRPDWDLFRDGCPGGESPGQIAERADRVIRRLRSVHADVLLFSSGHFLRVLAGRWLGLGPDSAGRYFLLSTASLSALGYEHTLTRPVIRLWNDDHHVEA